MTTGRTSGFGCLRRELTFFFLPQRPARLYCRIHSVLYSVDIAGDLIPELKLQECEFHRSPPSTVELTNVILTSTPLYDLVIASYIGPAENVSLCVLVTIMESRSCLHWSIRFSSLSSKFSAQSLFLNNLSSFLTVIMLSWCSENVVKLRYLGTTTTNKNSIQEEIKSRLNSGKVCYSSVQNILSSRLLSRNLKIKTYKMITLPVVLYGCETWSLTLREKQELKVF
jgi:hypothetical protein